MKSRAAALVMLLATGLGLAGTARCGATETTNTPATVKVSGYGLLGNLQLKRILAILREGTNQPIYYDANFVEDGALLLRSRLQDDGFLEPVIIARLKLEDGTEASYAWEKAAEEPLPRTLRARHVHFHVEEGVRYYLEELTFRGLHAIPEREARGYFVESGGLLRLKRNRIHTPERLQRGMANLAEELRRRGYREASVTAADVRHNPLSGAVAVVVDVREGPRFVVSSVIEEVRWEGGESSRETHTHWIDQPYSRFWEQDFEHGIKTNFFRQGYPDVTVEYQRLRSKTNDLVVRVDLLAVVRPGPRIRVGDVVFSGYERTRPSVLESRVPIREGDWLDRIRAERGRYRLSRLGVFESVTLSYETVDPHTRNVIYELDEGKREEVSLLFGYGSYELLRGGIQLDQYNLFGRAHHSRLRLLQSFKASSAEYTYTLPDFLGEDIDLFFSGSGLRREEVSFTRLEYGGGIGARKFFRRSATDVSIRYNYQVLEAVDADPDVEVDGVRRPAVGAFIGDIRHDRRDNPLYPRRGYKVFANIELASEYVGGDVDYQRLDMITSYHRIITRSHAIHLGLSHGFIAAAGDSHENIPFNRRFFPGGENSIRGYPEGEASPRNAEGDFVGAEAYVLGNVEFEQAITPNWSLVLFGDGLGYARDLERYPAEKVLFSVGAGIRWKTFIGPVRLEYGHNVNPRPGDPSGTVHFSLGFPF